jgi:hypothetical protein
VDNLKNRETVNLCPDSIQEAAATGDDGFCASAVARDCVALFSSTGTFVMTRLSASCRKVFTID